MPQPIVEVDGVGITFPKSRGRQSGMRHRFIHGFRRGQKTYFWALRDVSFSIQPGEAVGVIGGNGTGKSTLLKLISGGLVPDEGSVTLRGGVSLLELRAGLAKELSGRDNVFLLGALHGMDQRVLTERFDEIVRFAEVEDFIDTPVRRYSSGMQTRLAFSVVVQLMDSIVLVDEVLTVGDRRFRKKSYAAIEKMLADGRTLVLVSHNAKDLRRFCARGLYLKQGRLMLDGPLDEALEAYYAEDQQRKGRRRGGRGRGGQG